LAQQTLKFTHICYDIGATGVTNSAFYSNRVMQGMATMFLRSYTH